MCSCEWQYKVHREPQPLTRDGWEVKGMVMEINVILGVKAKIEAMVRDMTARGFNIFNVRIGDIKLESDQAPL